jgi:putative glycosyltransferase (TIGR04348 family)
MRAASTVGAWMSSTALPSIVIVCPAPAEADDAHAHVATRWWRMLRGHSRTALVERWAGDAADLMIAVDARRSAAAAAAWRRARPAAPLLLALTGTDLHRDLLFDSATQHTLQAADRVVVLHDAALALLSPVARGKARVVWPSARPLRGLPPPKARLRAVQLGTLCEDHDPMAFMRAARRLDDRDDIAFLQIGAAGDAKLEAAARRTAAECAGYQWLGALPRGVARQHLRHAQLLVAPNRIEGGASAIVDAAQSGTAVIAARIPGHVGLLGAEHAGLFPAGDHEELARLVEHARDDADFLARLRAQTAARAALFDPAAEARALVDVVNELLGAAA